MNVPGRSSRWMVGSAVMRSALAGLTMRVGMGGKVLAKEPFVARRCLQVRRVKGEFE
jgi:hypothetical protein